MFFILLGELIAHWTSSWISLDEQVFRCPDQRIKLNLLFITLSAERGPCCPAPLARGVICPEHHRQQELQSQQVLDAPPVPPQFLWKWQKQKQIKDYICIVYSLFILMFGLGRWPVGTVLKCLLVFCFSGVQTRLFDQTFEGNVWNENTTGEIRTNKTSGLDQYEISWGVLRRTLSYHHVHCSLMSVKRV